MKTLISIPHLQADSEENEKEAEENMKDEEVGLRVLISLHEY